EFLKNKKFMIPGKAFGITIGLGDNGDEDQAAELVFERVIDIVGGQQSVVGIFVEVNRDILLERTFKFCLQGIDKFAHPMVTFVILLAVGNKDVVFETGD